MPNQAEGMFGYKAPPCSGNPNREVIRWVQSLDLSASITNFRRDLANGFLIAQILHKYYPAEVQLHSFSNGMSTATKTDNWQQIQKICSQQSLPLPAQLMQGTAKGGPGAAVSLLEHFYEKLTKKSVQKLPPLQMPAVESTSQQHKTAGAFTGPSGGEAEDAPINATAGSKPILTNLQTGPGVDFGAVKIDAVEDPARLRQKLAAATQRPIAAS
ncbi:TPA: WW domain binding [Trebouxia sp. C0006]